MPKKKHEEIFDEEAINNVLELVDLVKRIRARLRAEGVDIEKAMEEFKKRQTDENQQTEENRV